MDSISFIYFINFKGSALQKEKKKVCTCKQIAAKLVAKPSIKDTSLPQEKGRQKMKGQVSEAKLLINSLNNHRNMLSKPYIHTGTLAQPFRIRQRKLGRVAFISCRHCADSAH